jgi:hypothetical protein
MGHSRLSSSIDPIHSCNNEACLRLIVSSSTGDFASHLLNAAAKKKDRDDGTYERQY